MNIILPLWVSRAASQSQSLLLARMIANQMRAYPLAAKPPSAYMRFWDGFTLENTE
jgi:hypothetical protein